MKWEYTVIYLASFELSKEANSLIDDLNEFGEMGWEMIAVDNEMIYFKRAIISDENDLVRKIIGLANPDEFVAIASFEKAVKRMVQREADD